MTDLRDQLADFEAAAARLRVQPATETIPLTPGLKLGTLLRQLRNDQGLTLLQVGRRCHVSRKAVCNRELFGQALPAGALIEHLGALGYDVIAVQRAGELTPDRRAA